MKKYNLKNIIEAQKKALELKHERRELRTKLDKFQKDFEANHKRKIAYTKDIGPVANEFKRYRELKAELQKFDTVLANQFDKKNNSNNTV